MAVAGSSGAECAAKAHACCWLSAVPCGGGTEIPISWQAVSQGPTFLPLLSLSPRGLFLVLACGPLSKPAAVHQSFSCVRTDFCDCISASTLRKLSAFTVSCSYIAHMYTQDNCPISRSLILITSAESFFPHNLTYS